MPMSKKHQPVGQRHSQIGDRVYRVKANMGSKNDERFQKITMAKIRHNHRSR